MPWYTSYVIQAYAFIGNTWKDTLWDLAAFVAVACTFWAGVRVTALASPPSTGTA